VLPCFEDPKVGAAGGPIGVQIPEERRDKNIITAWEVAGASNYLASSRTPPPNQENVSLEPAEADTTIW